MQNMTFVTHKYCNGFVLYTDSAQIHDLCSRKRLRGKVFYLKDYFDIKLFESLVHDSW